MYENGIDLKNILGVSEWAWKYDDVINIINILEKKDAVILGGDVLNQEFSYTGDNWAYENLDSKESIEKTKNYIKNYYQRMGNNYYYVLVVK